MRFLWASAIMTLRKAHHERLRLGLASQTNFMTEPDPKTTLREFREAAIEVLRPSSRQTIEEHCTQAVLVCLQSDEHQGDNAFYPLV
jgi:hypothetical protein